MGDAGSATSGTGSIQRIAIIGGGPVGIAFAKYLRAERAFSAITVYEQRTTLGGVWNHSAPTRSSAIPLPQTNPRYGQSDDDDVPRSLELESPLYDYLETNIPKPLMQYPDFPFDVSLPLFPGREAVREYLERYAEDVHGLVRFGTTVREVRRRGRTTWEVRAQDAAGQTSREVYDAVVVANGHYTVPYVPDIPGLSAWSARYPGSVLHSKAYRRPEDFAGTKVLVVGNSASGLDISAQLSRCCATPVLLSSRSVSAFGSVGKPRWREDVGEVVEFLGEHEGARALRFRDGRVERDVGAVVFATGYFYSYPFLEGVSPPLTGDGWRVQGLYKDLFWREDASLVFPVINTKVVPFPLAVNQAAVVARAWSGRLPLPSKDEMLKWEEDAMAKKGTGKYFHLQKFPGDARQINELYAWAETAHRKEGLENEGVGKTGTRWDEKMVWVRSKFPDIKAAFSERGDHRKEVRTIEQLGFDYDKWRESASDEEMNLFREAGC